MARERGGGSHKRSAECESHHPLRRLAAIMACGALCVLLTVPLSAQTREQPCPPQGGGDRSSCRFDADREDKLPSIGTDSKKVAIDIIRDQKYIWTSPVHLRPRDAEWLVPFAGITTGLIVTDRTTSHEISRGGFNHESVTLSNAALAGLGATAAGIYFLGRLRGDAQMRETGMLSAEALSHALIVDEALKYVLRRSRPDNPGSTGRFFQPGGASMPSVHAATGFAIATVIAHEYPQPLTQMLAYGTATAISFARVSGKQHYLSDVFVGGTLGYLIGRSTYNRHHDKSAGSIGMFETEAEPMLASQMGTNYIELDSWVYPAVERLAAMGLVNSQFMSLRPWTRMSVYQMLAGIDDLDLEPEEDALVLALRAELRREKALDDGATNRAIRVDNLYSRTQYISGPTLNDTFHFGQTLVDDFGRPYGTGLQQITGFESSAESGRLAYYVRGEYQHSPGVPGYSDNVNQILAQIDVIPGETYTGRARSDVFRLLDTYVSMKLAGHDFSVGKQTYWWNQDMASSMMLGNNVEPFYSLRINRNTPVELPLLSKLLGPFRYDMFFGALSGNRYPRHVFLYGQKINFEPTPNMEIGFARDAVIGGEGVAPLTIGNFIHSFFSVTSGTAPGSNPRRSPGARHGSFDFRYRLPKLRNWLTFYADGLVHDDISPIDSPHHAAWTAGIYLAKFPFWPKLDLHVEGGTTDTPTKRTKGGQYYYFESLFKDGYMNKGNLLGSWIGREGTGGQAWLTYWLNPQSTVKVGYRTLKTSYFFIPKGGTQSDGYAEVDYRFPSGLSLRAFVQGERWFFPMLAAAPKVDITTQFEVSFWPKKWRLGAH